MDIALAPGKYVVAVSGGVDSVALLHLLQSMIEVRLTVAHYDHGIREDSAEDARLVKCLARQYGLSYVSARGELGPGSSEALARQKRYEFLHKVRLATSAQSVITGHHQDDVLETAILNIVRGTGRRGMTSLRSTDTIKRPLLHVPKQNILSYARDNRLIWREDSTNSSDTYRRNYVRHQLLTRFEPQDRAKIHDTILAMHSTNTELDALLGTYVESLMESEKMLRSSFVLLPHMVAREVMHSWLRRYEIEDIDRTMIERLVHAAKTYRDGKKVSINHNNYLFVEKQYLALVHVER